MSTTPALDVPPSMRLYRVSEAQILLGLSRSVVYELMRSGRLRSVAEGRARRIPGSAIAEYIAQLEHEAETASRRTADQSGRLVSREDLADYIARIEREADALAEQEEAGAA